MLADNTEIARLQTQLSHARRLLEINRTLMRSIGQDTIFQQIVDAAQSLLPKSDHVVLHVVARDAGRMLLVPRALSSTRPFLPRLQGRLTFEPGKGIAGVVMQTQQTLNVPNVVQHSAYLHTHNEQNIVSLLVAPIALEGEFLGTLSANSGVENAFSHDDEILLTTFSEQAALALRQAQLLQQSHEQKQALQSQIDRLSLLYWVLRHVGLGGDLDSALNALVQKLTDVFPNTFIQIYLLNEDNLHLDLRYSAGIPDGYHQPVRHRLKIGQGLVGVAAQNQQMVWTNDVVAHPAYIRSPWLPPTAAEMVTPIVFDKKLFGTLDLQRPPKYFFDEQDQELLSALAGQIALAFHKLQLYNQLQENLARERRLRDQIVQTEKLTVLGRIVAAVAHELNNPLQAMHNALYLVSLEKDIGAQARQDLDIVIKEMRRMENLITRLRSLYSHQQNEKPVPISLNQLVEETREFLKTYLRQHQVQIILNLDESLPLLLLQTDTMKQVLLNLCFNAVEAMPFGGEIHLTTEYHPQQQEVYLSVRDTGTGIPEAIQDKIFEPFFTTKSEGSGLGLAICYDIVQQYGGRLLVQSEEGKGSLFIVRLPVSCEGA
ncbi:MAG: hypothetical protein OHK0052_23980 [Anaerolineales bacterium]